MATKIRVSTATCPACGTEIFSRARHDYRLCKCGCINVDGGFDYFKFGWCPTIDKPKTRWRYVKSTRQELYDDWNRRTDKFGIISQKGK